METTSHYIITLFPFQMHEFCSISKFSQGRRSLLCMISHPDHQRSLTDKARLIEIKRCIRYEPIKQHARMDTKGTKQCRVISTCFLELLESFCCRTSSTDLYQYLSHLDTLLPTVHQQIDEFMASTFAEHSEKTVRTFQMSDITICMMNVRRLLESITTKSSTAIL